MGVRGNRNYKNIDKPIHTEKTILECLNRNYLSKPKYLLNNLYVFDWESDYLAYTKSGYFYEIEVKISRSDFKNDFKNKKDKHLILENSGSGENSKIPNYFSYAVPNGLISVDEIPPYAGLYYINEYNSLKCVKLPIQLHKAKLNINDLNLTDKFYYNMVTWKEKYESYGGEYQMLNKENRELKKEIEQLNEQLLSIHSFYENELEVADEYYNIDK